MSTLINGYSLPSSHLTDSLLPRVERVRNWKSLVTSWNTTSRYSGWMPAFIGTHQLCGGKRASIAAVLATAQARITPPARAPPSPHLLRREGIGNQALEPLLVVAQQDAGIVGPALAALPVDDRGAARERSGKLDRDRPLGHLRRTNGFQCIGHRQGIGRMPAIPPGIARPQPRLRGDAVVEPGAR